MAKKHGYDQLMEAAALIRACPYVQLRSMYMSISSLEHQSDRACCAAGALVH